MPFVDQGDPIARFFIPNHNLYRANVFRNCTTETVYEVFHCLYVRGVSSIHYQLEKELWGNLKDLTHQPSP
jgi:hypothetical protein